MEVPTSATENIHCGGGNQPEAIQQSYFGTPDVCDGLDTVNPSPHETGCIQRGIPDDALSSPLPIAIEENTEMEARHLVGQFEKHSNQNQGSTGGVTYATRVGCPGSASQASISHQRGER